MEAKEKEDFPTDPKKLKEACERHQKNLASAKSGDFIKTGFFDIDKLQEVINLTQSKHVKVYYGVDEQDKHFLFIAPTREDGRARDDNDTTAALCCCQSPPCPPPETDRFAE
ncbi:hypothetical protein GCM10028805_59110 [Spirosoma harenae]